MARYKRYQIWPKLFNQYHQSRNHWKNWILSTYKEIKPLQYNYNPVYANDKYVTNIFNFEDFKDTKTAVIQSCTGTGKTTAIAKHMKEYISNDETNVYKILSIIDKITLGA